MEDKSTDKVFFVILTYRPDFLLLHQNQELLKKNKVIIVDNSEQADIREKLQKSTTGNVQLIINEKNTGYTGGMNKGIKEAIKVGAEWVVLLNDDVELSKESIEKVLGFTEKSLPVIAGPYPGYLDQKRWTSILPKYAKKNQKPDYLSGSFLIIHKDVISKIREFYPDYFMYYEDVDFCVQATKLGYPLTVLALKGVNHKEGATLEQGSPLHEYYLARNHLLFIERQAPLSIKLRVFPLLPLQLWRYKYYMNQIAFNGVIDFLFLRYGKKH